MIINSVRSIKRSRCGHVCAIRSAGEERASAPIRALLAAIVAFVCATSVVTYAFAEESGGGGGGHSFEGPNVGIIFYGPVAALDSNANQVNEVGVTAYNEFDAAAYVLGYSYGEVKSWSSDIRAKLSNIETGGRFWEFAKTFTHTSNIDGIQWFTANILYGEDLCWRSLYSDELFRNALADCQTIINGGDVGGGSGGGSATGFPHSLVLTNYVGDAVQITIQFSDSFVTRANQELVNYPYYQVAVCERYSGRFWFSLLFSNQPFDTYAKVVGKEGTNDLYQFMSVFHSDATYRYGSLRATFTKSGNAWTGTVTSMPSLGTLDATAGSETSRTGEAPVNGGYYNSSASSTPVVPPSNWPEEPSAPSPPELPEPGTNPTVTPTPWSPVISPSFDFDLNITTDPTSSDLIDWVQKIYYELKSFHTDAHDWAEDFGDGFTKVVQAVNSASSQLYSQLLVIDSSIHDEGLKIRNYMYQMFHWLAQQFDFQNDPFNDSNIVYWLKRIWSKLGAGDINVRPTDPTTDPGNWWDWLIKAIQNFLIGLAASANDLISEIADIASQVMHEFPFSIPWDIAAILAALTAAPITPAFTVTIPAIDGWWQQFDIVVDLKPFDTAAETIRLMEKLLFTGLLIWKSKDLLDFMDVTKWFD